MDNLFQNLHKLNSGWDEDFLTESFAYLLQYLFKNEPAVGKVLLHQILENRLALDDIDVGGVQVRTQVNTNLGTPDLWLDSKDHIVCIEVKVDSDFGDDQLIRYRKILDESGRKSTTLATLTRYPLDVGVGGCQPDVEIRWHKVADILEQSRPRSGVGKYLVGEFVDFLKHRGIAMESIGWELVPGVRSLENLINMLTEAAPDPRYNVVSHQQYRGWRTFADGSVSQTRVAFGIYLSDPGHVVVETESLNLPNDHNIEFGKIKDGNWHGVLDLTSADVHFFALSKTNQLSCLEEFLRENISFAEKLIESEKHEGGAN